MAQQGEERVKTTRSRRGRALTTREGHGKMNAGMNKDRAERPVEEGVG